jgi:hypothetical protein
VSRLLAVLGAEALGTYRVERRVRRTLAAAAARRRPIIAGPWTGERGYEALYWIPFLRWAVDRYGVDPQRVVALSPTGMEPCYAGIAGRVVDAVDLEEVGMPDAAVWSPSLMFDLFSAFWSGRRSLDFFFRHTDFRYGAPASGAATDPGRPAGYTAVELYTGTAIADSTANRALLRDVAERLAARMPVVMLDAASKQDTMRLIAGARQFVGTCGGFAWLAPFLGVDTVALYDDDRGLSTHLYAARYAYRKSRAARFSVLNLTALRAAGGALDTTS